MLRNYKIGLIVSLKGNVLIVLILLLIPLTCWAFGPAIHGMMSMGSGGGSCTTEVSADSESDGGTNYNVGGTRLKLAGSWTTSEAYDLCKIEVDIAKVGTPPDPISVKIYDATGAGGAPGNLLGTANETLSAGDVTTSHVFYTFTFTPSISLANGTEYFVSLETTTEDGSHKYGTYLDTATATGASFKWTQAGGAWAGEDATSAIYRKPYK